MGSHGDDAHLRAIKDEHGSVTGYLQYTPAVLQIIHSRVHRGHLLLSWVEARSLHEVLGRALEENQRQQESDT